MELLASVVLSICALTQSSACADCKGDPRRTVLCSVHLEAESSTLREQRALFAKARDAADRIASLERVAALTRAHSNAPSPIVARFLSDALRDDSLQVRRAALAALLDGQHPDETVRGVLDGWREGQKLWRVLDAKLVLSEQPIEAGKGSFALTNEELTEIPDYVLELLRGLGRVRDERSCNVLQSFLRSPLDRTPGRFFVAAAESMLQLDSRRSWEATITLLDELEDAFVDGELPRRFAGDPRTDVLAMLKAPLENATAHELAAIVELLSTYAKKRGLTPPESTESLRAADWRAWFKSARDTLPDKVTRS